MNKSRRYRFLTLADADSVSDYVAVAAAAAVVDAAGISSSQGDNEMYKKDG